MLIYQDIIDKKAKLAVIGLGYVGLPIALEFAKKVSVIGFDINAKRIDMMKQSIDPSNELDASAFEGCDIEFTNSLDVLSEAKFFIVAVPTPVDDHNVPDLLPVKKASETIGKVIKTGDYVVYESTVYPGCTEEDCLPIIEELSGLKLNVDFKLGYSPERINPGDKEHTLSRIIKVVSGSDAESLEEIAKTYEIVVKAGVHKASSIKVAEAAKIIENTQRDLNIALMNELSINDEMPLYVAKKIVQHIIKHAKEATGARVLIMGATFKENVSDIRNSKIIDMIKELRAFSLNVDIVDPYADNAELQHEYGFPLSPAIGKNYDAIILGVPHNEYKNLTEDYLLDITNPNAIFADLKGLYRNKFKNLKYWSL